MANQIVGWVYTADDGRDYITGINSEVGAQLNGATPAVALIGGRAATSADPYPPLPSSVKPRRVYLKNAAKKGRTVTVMTPTADLATIGAAIDLEDSDGASTTFTVRKLHSETFGRSRV
jgi:hypothetical protein